MTSLHGETVSANDLSLVTLLDSDTKRKNKSLFSKKDLNIKKQEGNVVSGNSILKRDNLTTDSNQLIIKSTT